MKISGYKRRDQQLTFDQIQRIDFLQLKKPDGTHNHGLVRAALGEYVEQLTAKLFGGRQHKTDSTCDYCPDVSYESLDALNCRRYLECKSCGQTRETFIYSGRHEKDKLFAKDHTLWYCIWHHKLNSKDCQTVGELYELFHEKMHTIYMVPFESIINLCEKVGETQINSGYATPTYEPGWEGGTQNPKTIKEYSSGYRINLSLLSEVPHYTLTWEEARATLKL